MVTGVPAFNECMSASRGYQEKEMPEKWEVVECLYSQNIAPFTEQKIPKKIHQIWLGSPVSDEHKEFIQTIKDNNSDYEYKLWTDKDVESFDFNNKKIFHTASNLGQKSDILRYAILKEFGGIYLDIDFICYKSFDSLLHLDFFVGVAYDKEPIVFNGLIGCVPQNNIICAANSIDEIKDGGGMQTSMEVIKTTGPWFLTEKIFKNYKEAGKVVLLPTSYFYPFPNHVHKHGDNYKSYIKEETICVHMWHGKW